VNIRGDLMVETSDGRTVKLREWIEAIEKRVAELERRVPEQPKTIRSVIDDGDIGKGAIEAANITLSMKQKRE